MMLEIREISITVVQESGEGRLVRFATNEDLCLYVGDSVSITFFRGNMQLEITDKFGSTLKKKLRRKDD